MTGGMNGKRQFQQMVLIRRDVVVHTWVQEGEHYLLLDEGDVLVLFVGGLFWGVVGGGFVYERALLEQVDLLQQDLVEQLGFVLAFLPPLGHALVQFLTAGS